MARDSRWHTLFRQVYVDRRLIEACDDRLAAYLEKRGLAPWQHRKKATDYVPGSLRYDVIRIFCEPPTDRLVATHELAYAVRDRYPVTEGHILVLPKRHVADYFDLHQPERNAIEELLHQCRQTLKTSDASINGFNIGANAGQSAGQTVFHVHVHLIPRRTGDVNNPRGGVRGVIPERQDYVVG